MTNIKNITEAVTEVINAGVVFKAQGESGIAKLADMHPDSVAYMLQYGVRRAIQDWVNSQAKSHRDAGESFDPAKLVADRLAQANTGSMSSRGAGGDTDPLDKYRRQVVRAWMSDTSDESAVAFKAAYDAIPSDDQSARQEFLLEFARENESSVDPVAVELKKADEAKARKTVGLKLNFKAS